MYYTLCKRYINKLSLSLSLARKAGATNTNIITGSVVSSKGNVGGLTYKSKGVLPPTRKFKEH